MGLANREMFERSLLKELRINAVVRKACVCGQPAATWDTCPSCGRVAVTEDKGLVSYRHKSWWKNLLYLMGFIK